MQPLLHRGGTRRGVLFHLSLQRTEMKTKIDLRIRRRQRLSTAWMAALKLHETIRILTSHLCCQCSERGKGSLLNSRAGLKFRDNKLDSQIKNMHIPEYIQNMYVYIPYIYIYVYIYINLLIYLMYMGRSTEIHNIHSHLSRFPSLGMDKSTLQVKHMHWRNKCTHPLSEDYTDPLCGLADK